MSHLQQNIQQQGQDVFDIVTTECSTEYTVCVHQSLQSEEVMAARFHEDLAEASIQTRAEIQEESKAKVGKTEMDEGC
jgi:hypothetical protein